MPAEIVADDRETLLVTEGNEFVRLLEFELIIRGLQGFPFHRIFRRRTYSLEASETAVLNEPSKLLEARATRLYAGGGTRVEGIYVGGGQSASSQTLKEVDSGTLTLTTKRLVFTGSMESRVVQFNDIVAVDAIGDAIELSVGNKAKRQIYLVHNPIIWSALLRTYSNTCKA